ncbi:glycoside-pentoside-hexuronide (GPH):cation symporter [Lachnospiraceae bacterium OttesenSCG-928-J05]|nr:glycoside-pentoside-hexuronide (GPH):cation symporter [Lachnospiraceae bacterium OttesenSCG-928-J05]
MSKKVRGMIMDNKLFRTSGIERWGFGLFMAGQSVINTFAGSFLPLFLTNIGITAYAVGVLFLFARVWDAVNDPIFGAILDRTNLKSGKFLPFLRAANVMLPVTVVLMFAIPSGISTGWKILWAFVSYLLFDIAYTMCDVPIFAMTSAVTDQVHERINIMSRNTVLSTLTAIVVAVAGPGLYSSLGPLPTAVILSIVAAFLMFFMSRYAKERYVNKDEEEVTLKSMLNYVKSNKYLRIGFLGIMILSVTSMTNAVITYFAVNCLGNLGMVSVLSLFIALPSLVMGVLMPVLTRKFDKFHLLMVGIIGQTVMSVVCFLAGYENQVLFFILLGVRGIFFGIQLILQLQFTGDFVEYGEFVTGKRLQGTAYSIQTFVFKFMNAVPGAVAMFILGAFGFVSGEGAVQPPSAINAIWVLFILSPVIGALISLPIFAKYKLRDKMVQIMAAANSGDITREEAQEQLAGKL